MVEQICQNISLRLIKIVLYLFLVHYDWAGVWPRGEDPGESCPHLVLEYLGIAAKSNSLFLLPERQ